MRLSEGLEGGWGLVCRIWEKTCSLLAQTPYATMRLADGVSVSQLAANTGTSITHYLIPDRPRLREALQDHFQACAHLYGIGGAISTLDVRPVVGRYKRVVDYVFKTIKKGRVTYDEGVPILPRAQGELTPRIMQHGPALDDRLISA